MLLISLSLVAILAGEGCVASDDEAAMSRDEETVDLNYQELLDKQVLKLSPYVEKKTGLKYNSPPKAKFPTREEYKQTLKKAYPNARDYSKLEALVIAIYDKEEKLVVVNPGLFESWLESEFEGKESKHWNMAPALVHELTHVLQEQAFQLISTMKTEKDGQRKFVLSCLADGHAALIEEYYAEDRLKMKDYFTRRYNIRQHRHYVFGRNYLKRILKDEGVKGISKVLGGDYPDSSTLIDMGYANPDKDESNK